ncbi:MAG TPA: putative molybdenum carrier protein [Stellaceae bacterium]|nr:putative molybdenum carrier protein [Stellaceae bacterium]
MKAVPAKIVSGGQTGADRAALDWAIARGIAHGGWCPKGRRAEDGPIDPCYALTETPSRRYAERTLWNVRDSDATLIANFGRLDGGSLVTRRFAEALARSCLVVQIEDEDAPTVTRRWLDTIRPATLNIAGPRESRRPGIYARTLWLLDALIPPTSTG